MDEQRLAVLADELLNGNSIMIVDDQIDDETVDVALVRLKQVENVLSEITSEYEKELAELNEKHSVYSQCVDESKTIRKKLEAYIKDHAEEWQGKKLKFEHGLLEIKEGSDALWVEDEIHAVIFLKEEFPDNYFDFVDVKFALKKNPIKEAIKSDLITNEIRVKAGLSVKPTEKPNVKLY